MSENNNRHNHRRNRDRDRITREYDRPKYDRPVDRPFSRRNYDHRQHDNERNPIHTVFLFNLDFSTTIDQLKEFASEYGEIAPDLFYQPPKKKGMVFITYYDIRSAIRMVDEGRGRILNGKPIETAYAYRPPTYSKRDPRDICSSTIYESESTDTNFTSDDVRRVAEEVGEVRSFSEVSKGKFDVVYFDLRDSKKAVEKKEVDVNGAKFKIEYNLEEGIGDSPVFNEVSKPKSYNRDKALSSKSEKSYSKNHGDSKRSKSPTEHKSDSSSLLQFPPGAAYAFPYQYAYGYPYPYGYQYPMPQTPSIPIPVQPMNTAALPHPVSLPQYQTQLPLNPSTMTMVAPPPPMTATTFPNSIPQMPLQNSNQTLQQFFQKPPEIQPSLQPTNLLSQTSKTSSLFSSGLPVKPSPPIKPTTLDFHSSFDNVIFNDHPSNPFGKESDLFVNSSNSPGSYQSPASSQMLSKQSSSIMPAEPIPMQNAS